MFTTSIKYYLVTICLAILSTVSYAQQFKYEQKADRAAKDQDFYTAAVYYEKAIALKQESAGGYKPYNGEVLELKAAGKAIVKSDDLTPPNPANTLLPIVSKAF